MIFIPLKAEKFAVIAGLALILAASVPAASLHAANSDNKVSITPVVSKPLTGVAVSNNALPVKPVQKPFVRPVPFQTHLTEVQNQIKDVIELNQKTRPVYRSQAIEVQKIRDQAVIHQKILQDMQARRTVPSVNPSDIDEMIRLEKIRLIQEQTLRDRETVQTLSANPAGSPALSPPSDSKDAAGSE